MSSSYRVSAKGLILMDGKVLLVRKSNGDWSLPGGRLEEGEAPENAMMREVLEETDIHCQAGPLFHSFVRPRPGLLDVFVVVYFAKTDAGPEDVKLSHEHDEFGLFSFSESTGLTAEYGLNRTLELAASFYNQ